MAETNLCPPCAEETYEQRTQREATEGLARLMTVLPPTKTVTCECGGKAVLRLTSPVDLYGEGYEYRGPIYVGSCEGGHSMAYHPSEGDYLQGEYEQEQAANKKQREGVP